MCVGVTDGVASLGLWDVNEVTVYTIMAACSNSIGFILVLFRSLRRGQDPCPLDSIIAQRKIMLL